MKKIIGNSIALAFVLLSSYAQATFIEISQNGAVTPGAKVYVASNSPYENVIPFKDPGTTVGVPSPQYSFSLSDDVRVAAQYDLTQITQSDLAPYGDPTKLDWAYSFTSWVDHNVIISGTIVDFDWATIQSGVAAGYTAVGFSSASLQQLGASLLYGGWTAYTYMEGQLISQIDFDVPAPVSPVPEPAPLALLALGLFAVGYRRAKHSKV